MTLTLDPNIQIESEKILQALVAANNATGGSVIVEEPKTGKILAMAGYPTFDPNQYASSSFADFLNPTVQSIYEPGSIFKVLTMATGIDAEKLRRTRRMTIKERSSSITTRSRITILRRMVLMVPGRP